MAIPLKTTTGKDFKKHAALDRSLGVKGFNIGRTFVFCMGNLETKGRVTYLPWCMLMFFGQELPSQQFNLVPSAPSSTKIQSWPVFESAILSTAV